MLGVRTYTREYIDGCRSRVESDVSTFRAFLSTAKTQNASNGTSPITDLDALERTFFNNMVLVLDYMFVHRLRTLEGKNGNPLNEVRVLCNSLLENNGILRVEKPISLSPEKSVLKYRVGDEIRLDEADFARISNAFFAEIEATYQ